MSQIQEETFWGTTVFLRSRWNRALEERIGLSWVGVLVTNTLRKSWSKLEDKERNIVSMLEELARVLDEEGIHLGDIARHFGMASQGTHGWLSKHNGVQDSRLWSFLVKNKCNPVGRRPRRRQAQGAERLSGSFEKRLLCFIVSLSLVFSHVGLKTRGAERMIAALLLCFFVCW